MSVGYRIAALLWAIACASYGISEAHGSGENATTITSRDFSTTTPTTTETTSADTSSPNMTESSLEETIYDVTPTKSESICVTQRSKEFYRCLNNLGDNAMKHFQTRNLTEFLADLCDPDISKPDMDCIGKHFKACPEFLDTIHVRLLQFGPYHVKDIIYFYSADHMCDCAIGLVCVQEYIKARSSPNFVRTIFPYHPLIRIPDYKMVCDKTTGKWIDCVRKHLQKCETALNRKFHAEFTFEHAQEVKRMYDFRREHCDTIALKDFDKENQCIEDFNQKIEYKQCLEDSQVGSPRDKLCGLRGCVENSMGRICNASTVSVYIDAVNIFRHEKPKMLNFPCSSAIDVGLSIFTIVFSVMIVCVF